jgi:hypothetical protein
MFNLPFMFPCSMYIGVTYCFEIFIITENTCASGNKLSLTNC